MQRGILHRAFRYFWIAEGDALGLLAWCLCFVFGACGRVVVYEEPALGILSGLVWDAWARCGGAL